MTKKKLKPSILQKRFDNEVVPLVEKIILEEALTGVVSDEVVLDYWQAIDVEATVPVIFKASKMENEIEIAFRVEVNIKVE